MIQEYLALAVFLSALAITIAGLVRFFAGFRANQQQGCGSHCDCHGKIKTSSLKTGTEAGRSLKYRHVKLK